MADTLQSSYSIAQLKDQLINGYKNDKSIKPSIIRQPSNSQIRIIKNNRQSNYKPSQCNAISANQGALLILSSDSIPNQSELFLSSNLCLTDCQQINFDINPTQQIVIEKQIQPTTNNSNNQIHKGNEQSQIEISNGQKQPFPIIQCDQVGENNELHIQSRSIFFGDLGVLSFNQKKAENNKINHKMYMMSNLNKFKKDKLDSDINQQESIKLSVILQYEKQISFKPLDAASKLNPSLLEQDSRFVQQLNQLQFSDTILSLKPEDQPLSDLKVSEKIITFRTPLMQEQCNINQQSLSISQNKLQDIKEFFIQCFPCRPLKFRPIKLDQSQKEASSLQFSLQPLPLQNQTKNHTVHPHQNIRFTILKNDLSTFVQPFIYISDKTLSLEQCTPIRPCQLTIKDEVLQKFGLKAHVLNDFSDRSNSLKSFSQNTIVQNNLLPNQQKDHSLKVERFKMLKELQRDKNNLTNSLISELQTCNFPAEVVFKYSDKVSSKEVPQYPTIIEMNRMKIEKIKQLIAEGSTSNKHLKQRRASQNTDEANSDETDIQQKQVRLFENLPIIKSAFQNVNGSFNLEVSCEIANTEKLKIEKKRSTSIERLPQHMQMSKNQTSMLNRFKKIKYLGRGQMSDVYSVLDSKTGMVLALKTIQKSLINSKQLNNLILNEIKISVLLKHQNILKCFGVINDNKQLALILELSDQTLYNYIHQQKITRFQMIDVLFQVLSAVNYLHNLGIIHRDIKPENILICNKVIKLADLGISIRAESCTQYCGTLGYMAPEVKHYQRYTNKIDCYSIGVLIYEMLHNKLPNSTIYPIKNPTGDQLIELMNNLVEPDENFRYSCSQALESEVFKDLNKSTTMNWLQQSVDRLLSDRL